MQQGIQFMKYVKSSESDLALKYCLNMNILVIVIIYFFMHYLLI